MTAAFFALYAMIFVKINDFCNFFYVFGVLYFVKINR